MLIACKNVLAHRECERHHCYHTPQHQAHIPNLHRKHIEFISPGVSSGIGEERNGNPVGGNVKRIKAGPFSTTTRVIRGNRRTGMSTVQEKQLTHVAAYMGVCIHILCFDAMGRPPWQPALRYLHTRLSPSPCLQSPLLTCINLHRFIGGITVTNSWGRA
jgi:hypothetical protein